MEDYEIGTQQIIRINYDNINYELKYMGQVVQIKGNLSDGGVYVKNITISFVTNQRYLSIDVSDYAEDNIKYYPVFVAGDFSASHLESRCIYISSVKTLRLYCDGLATTGQGETGNTLLLIPISSEEDIIEGVTNGRYMGEYAPYYTKSEITTLLSGKQNTLTFDATPTENSTNPVTSGGLYTAFAGKQAVIDSSHKLSADLIDDSTSTNKFVTAEEKTAWDNKQSALTFDNTPTENSTNPVTSGGLYDIIGDVVTLINAL